jgi:hypothetical protein
MKTQKVFVIALLTIAILGIGYRLYQGRAPEAAQPENETEPTSTTTSEAITGMLTWGGEVRSFVPCGDSERDAAWIIPATPETATAIRTGYETVTEDRMAYTPVLATVMAEPVDPPTDGFGAGYARALYVTGVSDFDALRTCQSDEIMLDEPLSGTTVSSPLTISGQASGSWMFEGQMQAILTDWNGLIIAEGPLTAEGEWMTAELVPFSGELEFDMPEYGERGNLIIQAANPSGLPEHDAAYEIVVTFASDAENE